MRFKEVYNVNDIPGYRTKEVSGKEFLPHQKGQFMVNWKLQCKLCPTINGKKANGSRQLRCITRFLLKIKCWFTSSSVLYIVRRNYNSLTFTAASNDVLGLAKETITEFQKPVSFSRVVSMVKRPKVKYGDDE